MAGDGNMKRFVIGPHSLCYVHPSEGPGVVTTNVIFDEKNYDLWEWVVWTTLKEKNKLGFIDRTLTKPQLNEDQDFSESNGLY